MLAINKVSGRWPVALKAAIAVAGPVFVAAWVGDARAGLLTGLGAFTVLYGPTPQDDSGSASWSWWPRR